MQTKSFAQLKYEADLAAAVKCARSRSVLLVDENDRGEIAMFATARKLDTGDGPDGWIERYQQALDIYNCIITIRDPKQIVPVPQIDG